MVLVAYLPHSIDSVFVFASPADVYVCLFVCLFVCVAVMCKFKHPNIIKLYGVVSHMDLAYIVMELAPHGQV